jgi:aminopeptidase
MDPRIEQHAEVIVEHSTAVEPDDDVRVVAPAVAEDLVVAIAEQLGERGANPAYHLRSQRASRAYMRAADEDSFTLAEHRLAEMEETDVVILVRGDTTDVRMSVDGMVTANDYAELNLPGGEVYTAPRPDSVEGEVLFDKPLMAQGREVEDARLVFEGGEVVEYSAVKNEDVLGAVLDTDEGARRLGELGIGMNRDIDRFTDNMLFDEKMGETIHLAIGKAIQHTVPEGEPMNESATHMDMIVDMSEDSFIEVDGEVVQRNGTFRFEEGFEVA